MLGAMNLQLVRHATLLVDFAGSRLLVDPMLGDPGTAPPIENSPNQRPNPLVPLPMTISEILRGIDAVLVTHTHRDHWDPAAAGAIAKKIPLFGQVEDEARFVKEGFTDVHPVAPELVFEGIQITRTGGQHGTGEVARMLAPVSGFVLRAPGEPTLYIAGDTIWCTEVDNALRHYNPAVTVVNAGGARFLQGDPITMTPEDVMAVCQAAPHTRVIAVHMEAINHCIVTRDDLRFQLDAERVLSQVEIPGDGERCRLPVAQHADA
jgi:L-ascorbate metabolism protein UlaG (beta-lactamase superfamily)